MHWLYDLPLWLLCAMFIGCGVALAAAGVLLVRRLGWTMTRDDNGPAAALHAFIGVLYAVALALMVVAVQEDYGEVEAAVLTEANAADDMFRALDAVQPAPRAHLMEDLSGYVDSVIRDEWPASRHGETSAATWRTVDELAREIHTFQPTTPAEERIHPELLEALDELLDARGVRLFLGEQGIGAVTWMVILVGGVITLGFACFFHMDRVRTQLLLTGMMGAMFGLMLFLLVAMDHPLWGKLSVQPDAFRELQRNFARLRAEAPVPAPLLAEEVDSSRPPPVPE
ncbi:MAG TPA: hypothetical protein VF746_08550 [Longimicrobium sp.]|jgi:hypothetical protein